MRAFRFRRALSASINVVLCGSILGGCALIEGALSPRTYSVNEGADSVLNNTILLNILRAANSEPLNFVAISKYTAAGQLGLNSQVDQVTYAAKSIHPASQFGPHSISGQASGSFDLNVLETKDFYTGLLRGLDPSQAEVWFHQGLPHELVYYVLLDSIRTTHDGSVYEYKNDPADSTWHVPSGQIEFQSDNCVPVLTGRGRQTNYDLPGVMWYGLHSDDCRFEKFRYLTDLAVKYGLRFESISVPNPNWTKDSKTEPRAISKLATCYDPAIFREYSHSKQVPGNICGRNGFGAAKRFSIGGPGELSDIRLAIRSPFAIFQYLGRLIATDSTQRVRLLQREDVLAGKTTEAQVLNVVSGVGEACFAEAWYRGAEYCVPEAGSENTKRIFTLLRAVLATNISAADLNSSPTIRVTP
jgi:hypothetical protein